MTRYRALLLAFLAVTSGASPAIADVKYPTTVVAQASAPVSIQYCEALLSDPARENIDDYFFDGVDFINRGSVAATAVKFRFDAFDAFGAPLGTYFGTTTGSFASNQLIRYSGHRGGWHQINLFVAPGTLNSVIASVKCSVETVAFADGTSWAAP